MLPALAFLSIFSIYLMLQFSFPVCMSFILSINVVVCYIKNYENRFVSPGARKLYNKSQSGLFQKLNLMSKL